VTVVVAVLYVFNEPSVDMVCLPPGNYLFIDKLQPLSLDVRIRLAVCISYRSSFFM
jgi:hypothetical protein